MAITTFPIPTQVFNTSSIVRVLNVKDFGATGDGTTNDTTAIQAALDAVPAGGGLVFVPRGVYRVLIPNITVSGTQLVGEGDGSCLKLVDSPGSVSGGATVLRINRDGVDPIENVRIANLQIDGNKSTFGSVSASAEGIDSDNTVNLTIENCYIHDVNGDAIDCDGNNPGLQIRNNRIKDGNLQALHIYGANDAIVTGNQIENCSNTPDALATHPVDFLAFGTNVPDGIIFSNNTIRGCGGGLDVRSVQGILVEGNAITDTTTDISLGDGILVRSSGSGINRRIVVRGNYIRNTAANGILVTGSNIVIEGNTIVNPATSGFEIRGNDNIIRNNTVMLAGTQGVRLLGCANPIIENNTILNAVSRGIRAETLSGVHVSNAVIRGNHVLNSGANSIDLVGPNQRFAVTENYIESTAASTAVLIAGESGSPMSGVIARNTIRTSAASTSANGISLRNVSSVVVSNNTALGPGGGTRPDGITVRDATNVFVHGNRATGQNRGVWLRDTSSDIVITENDVRGNTSGVTIAGSGVTLTVVERNYGQDVVPA